MIYTFLPYVKYKFINNIKMLFAGLLLANSIFFYLQI